VLHWWHWLYWAAAQVLRAESEASPQVALLTVGQALVEQVVVPEAGRVLVGQAVAPEAGRALVEQVAGPEPEQAVAVLAAIEPDCPSMVLGHWSEPHSLVHLHCSLTEYQHSPEQKCWWLPEPRWKLHF
jgi:hypothetical protein